MPYLQRIRSYYQALGYGAPYEWAHYADVPFQRLRKPLRRVPGGARHDRRAVPARQGRPGSGRAVQRARRSSIGVYSGDTRSTTICASPTSRSIASTRPPRTSAAWFPLAALRRARGAPAASARSRRASTARRPTAASARRSRSTAPSSSRAAAPTAADAAILVAQLPGLPPDHGPRRAAARGERHRHRRHGLRQGHRRARRRAALPVLRLPARQRGGPAERPCVAGRDARARAARCSNPRRRRARRCSRRCAGATTPTGSSTTATSRG